MQRYVLTERGKYAVVFMVAFFLIITSLILAIIALTRENAEPILEETPGGGDLSPPPLFGLLDFNLNIGVMSFLVPEEIPPVFDENIITMLAQLFESPRYKEGTTFAVEIPQLPDEDAALITSASISALTSLGVEISDITFFVYQVEELNSEIVVYISLQ